MSALQAQLADLWDLWWNLIVAEAELRVEPEPAAPRQRRSLIESRALSKLASFDSKATSRKVWALRSRTWPQPWSHRRETLFLANIDSRRRRSRSWFRGNQSSNLRCAGRASGRRSVGHCTEQTQHEAEAWKRGRIHQFWVCVGQNVSRSSRKSRSPVCVSTTFYVISGLSLPDACNGRISAP